jgi:hypothetical protein
MNNVMIDLETLGLTPNAAFISLGACRFSPETAQIGDSFYERINWETAMDGREVTPATLRWWMQQGDDARLEIIKPGRNMKDVLDSLYFWLGSDCVVWGNGSTFDISILEDAYRQCGINIPWKFWNVRDVRTVVDLAKGLVDKNDVAQEGTAHNALGDAVYQAKYVSKMWQALRPQT